MAETFEIRSKSFTVKWINVPSSCKLKWMLRPLKNSINLGIYQQKTSTISPTPQLSSKDANSNYASDASASALTPPQSATASTPTSLNTPVFPSTINLDSNSEMETLDLNQVNEVPHRFFNTSFKSNFSDSSASSLLTKRGRSSSVAGNSSISNAYHNAETLEERLGKDLKLIKWVGKCAGDSLKTGTIKTVNGGLYAFVFDNTFSKTKAKNVLFQYEIKEGTSVMQPNEQEQQSETNSKNNVKFNLPKNAGGSTRIINYGGVQYLEGFLMKKKRRNNKGPKNFSKRFFSLNLTYSILYYYSNNDSNNIRGNMMITQTVVSADVSELMFYLDSGMEQWVLKATSKKDFDTWVKAFNFVKVLDKKVKASSDIKSLLKSESVSFSQDEKSIFSDEHVGIDSTMIRGRSEPQPLNPQFQVVESKILSLKTTINELIDKDSKEEPSSATAETVGLAPSTRENSTSQKGQPPARPQMGSQSLSKKLSKPTLKDGVGNSPVPMTRKPSFLHRLKRKGSQSIPSTGDNQPSVGNSEVPVISSTPVTHPLSDDRKFSSDSCKSGPISSSSISCSNIADDILTSTLSTNKKLSKMILDSILERVVELETEYAELVKQESKYQSQRSESRVSLDRAKSILSQEFFDAQEYADETELGVVILNDKNEDYTGANIEILKEVNEDELHLQLFPDEKLVTSSSSSDVEDDEEEEEDSELDGTKPEEISVSGPLDLYPLLPGTKASFREDVKPAACEPPSLISILRKGIGKDITSMTMPISTNEPLSFLQKYTESLEYSNLIDGAFNSPLETGERILKISAFAISFLSSYRDKVRSIRKPFNPLLGETYELVHPDLNIRVITEKVVHKPFIMAARIDSTNWFINHALSPQQKFYGKTAEISMDGPLKLHFRKNNEFYEWSQPNTILRNIVSLTGEKYNEPVDSITVKSNTGYKCVVTFINANTRFTSNRSEKVELMVYKDKSSKPLPLVASGSWTQEIKTNKGEVIWRASELLPQHEKKYGFTKFSCCLNDMNRIHEKCAPTDSRRRPDQRMYENGIVDDADELKLKLEENQRLRRKDSNGNDVVHQPKFFQRGTGELDWTFVEGEKSYWNRRKRGDWDDLIKLW